MDSSKQTPSSCHHQASCGEKTTKVATVFSAYQAEKAAQHPCYSSHAQHQFARMHLAVAPACNVQCHYCNRKYDCVNESRPGVVSEVLSIDEAVRKAKQVAAAIPQLSVIGIAGPGDPLANHYKTFQTLERLRSEVPDIKLCISTNGLALPAAVTDLVRLGVDHVTVTLNAIDAHIGAQIYDWFYLNGQRYRGKEGAQLLIDQQVEGIRKLVEQGILVKVNTVLIPGINELHVGAVGQAMV
jgi:nitrogen fixation protein NifB